MLTSLNACPTVRRPETVDAKSSRSNALCPRTLVAALDSDAGTLRMPAALPSPRRWRPPHPPASQEANVLWHGRSTARCLPSPREAARASSWDPDINWQRARSCSRNRGWAACIKSIGLQWRRRVRSSLGQAPEALTTGNLVERVLRCPTRLHFCGAHPNRDGSGANPQPDRLRWKLDALKVDDERAE